MCFPIFLKLSNLFSNKSFGITISNLPLSSDLIIAYVPRLLIISISYPRLSFPPAVSITNKFYYSGSNHTLFTRLTEGDLVHETTPFEILIVFAMIGSAAIYESSTPCALITLNVCPDIPVVKVDFPEPVLPNKISPDYNTYLFFCFSMSF